MAAVSAQYGLASSSSNTKGHQVHNFDNQADRSDDDNDDNSDAYSFEARSEAGDGASATAPGSDAVRPDSLTLTSPLEQLTRSLSFNKKEGSHGGRNGTPRTPRYRQHTPSDLPPVEQVMLEYLAGEPTQEASASTYETYDQWPRKATDTTHQQHSKLASRSAHQEQASEPANVEPVYFGDDDEPMVAEDPSEGGQGQLISAFRSSYHTYMTRSGGMRDSSYSWMAPDADSPNATLDFKQAELSHSQSANNKDSSSDVDRFEDHQGDRNRREFDPDGYEQWDAESKARARASSWDSQAAKTTGLHRIPSQKTSKTPMDGRASEMSAFEPFQYSVSLAYEVMWAVQKHKLIYSVNVISFHCETSHTSRLCELPKKPSSGTKCALRTGQALQTPLCNRNPHRVLDHYLQLMGEAAPLAHMHTLLIRQVCCKARLLGHLESCPLLPYRFLEVTLAGQTSLGRTIL